MVANSIPDTDSGIIHVKAPRFARVPEKMIHDQTLTDGALRLYAHMIWRYGKNQQNFEGRASMAEFLGVSEATISHRLAELESHNWIVVIPRAVMGAGRRTNVYHIFLRTSDCIEWRNETGNVKRGGSDSAPGRKSRKGVGGRNTHKPKMNSSSSANMNSGSLTIVNLSSHELDTENYLDSKYIDSDSLRKQVSAHLSDDDPLGLDEPIRNEKLTAFKAEQAADHLIAASEMVGEHPTLKDELKESPPPPVAPRPPSPQQESVTWAELEAELRRAATQPSTPTGKHGQESVETTPPATVAPETPIDAKQMPSKPVKTAKPRKPKADPITKALNEAIATHIQGIDPALAGGLTGTLAQKAAGIWRKRLGKDGLTRDEYAAVARSIPRFVEVYKRECEGCDLPTSPDKFESWYSKLLPIMLAEKPAAPVSEWVSIPHPDPAKAALGITKTVRRSEVAQ